MILIHKKIEERNQGHFSVFSTRPPLYTPCLLLVKINICDTSEDQNWLAGHVVCVPAMGSQKRISVDLFSQNLALDLLRNTSHQHLQLRANQDIKVAKSLLFCLSVSTIIFITNYSGYSKDWLYIYHFWLIFR